MQYTLTFEELFTLGLIHFARYIRLTKGDKVKHMLVSLDAIQFEAGVVLRIWLKQGKEKRLLARIFRNFRESA